MTTAPYLDTATAAAFSAMRNIGVFWRLDLPTVTDGDQSLRIWMGVNDCPIGIDSIDPAGSVYLGAGRLLNVPELEVLINGKADRIEFFLSGVPSDVVAKIDEAAPPVKGKEVHIGIAPLDDNWQPLTSIIPLWMGIADYWSVKMEPTKDLMQPHQNIIALSVGSGATGRSRARRVSFSDLQQKAVYPTDRAFERVVRYSQSYTVTWPRF